LTAFPAALGAAAEKSLLRLGVRVKTGAAVAALDEGGVTLGNGERIEARTVLWGAGVKASPLGAMLGGELDKAGRVVVTPTCQVPGRPEVFVLGDMAAIAGQPLPGVAPVAMQQGAHVSQSIGKLMMGKELTPFQYVDKGNLATIGRAAAIADLGKVQMSGWMAWLLWLFIHIMYLVGFRNRVQVFVHWAFQYWSFNRGARLITLGRQTHF
jgi:NADH dehydrogenase